MTALSQRFLSSAAANAVMPFLFLRAGFDAKWRASLGERLGFGDWRDFQAPSGCLWFHAASVGEVKGLIPILANLEEIGIRERVVLTTTSQTGKQLASEHNSDGFNALFPIDHPSCITRVLNKITPKIFVCAETELWPNTLLALKRRKVPVVIVNGRISDYSYPRYLRFKGYFAPILSGIDRVLTQSERDAERFLALGTSVEAIRVVGSTKYDNILPRYSARELYEAFARFGIKPRENCFIAGSVRPGEDEIVLEAFLAAKKVLSTLQMIIAPRHPERFDAVAEVLRSRGVSFCRWSEGGKGERADVLLLDTMGELNRAYAAGSCAFVGATLVDIGGHNPMEPAGYRVPVIVGPYHSNITDAVTALESRGAGKIVRDAAELSEALLHFLGDAERNKRSGSLAYSVWKQNVGASKKVVEELSAFLEDKSKTKKAAAAR